MRINQPNKYLRKIDFAWVFKGIFLVSVLELWRGLQSGFIGIFIICGHFPNQHVSILQSTKCLLLLREKISWLFLHYKLTHLGLNGWRPKQKIILYFPHLWIDFYCTKTFLFILLPTEFNAWFAWMFFSLSLLFTLSIIETSIELQWTIMLICKQNVEMYDTCWKSTE